MIPIPGRSGQQLKDRYNDGEDFPPRAEDLKGAGPSPPEYQACSPHLARNHPRFPPGRFKAKLRKMSFVRSCSR
jgi:hypothetical protein